VKSSKYVSNGICKCLLLIVITQFLQFPQISPYVPMLEKWTPG
jgi:hypothetical protein